MAISKELQDLAINTIRFLSADGVQQANSGHPGLPMGTAAMAYTVWTKHLRCNPENPNWANRDRFILSGGHGSMLLYSLLHLTGYDLSLEELKHFRQWGSKTPGHPEIGLTPGVETTTGPLGQGFANGVGMAIAEAHLASLYNKPDHTVVDHFTYAIVTDGDLMEGVTAEAASIAGHLKLGKLIYLYDDNHISIEGSTDITFTEDRGARFAAYGWQVLHVEDGNDVDAIDAAIQQAKADARPSLIICRTIIGYGLPTRQGTAKAHGEPPGDEELNNARLKMGWTQASGEVQPRFYIPEKALALFRKVKDQGQVLESEWNARFADYQSAYPEQAGELDRRLTGKLPIDWDKNLPEFPVDAKGVATRVSSGKVINALAASVPELVGGSADLAPSTNTWIQNSPAFQASDRTGRNFHFGVREHSMGSIVNGLALHKGVIPFGATFFVFSDYMRPTLRISALSHIPSIWIFTHDSIGLGEDGPTHQPVEHLAALRAIPHLTVIRPADANEVREAWKYAIENRSGPTTLVLTRQNLPTLDRSIYKSAANLAKGAYVLADLGNKKPEIILMASGSEVSLIIEAGQKLAAAGAGVRLVSFPSWDLFAKQSQEYRDEVLPPHIIKRVSVEAGLSFGWEHWTGEKGISIGINDFGASAPAKTLFEKYGLTVDQIIEKSSRLLK